MADQHPSHGAAPSPAVDSELDFKSIIWFAIILTVVTLIVLALMWGMSVVFKEAEQSKDRPPSPMAEALVDPIPPGPRLQSTPPRDMDELRVQDKEALGSYGWIDQSAGLAHIPIDRAMSIVLEKGVGPQPDKKKEAR